MGDFKPRKGRKTMTEAKTYTVPVLFDDILHQAHTLIAGRTGSGKSVMLNGILTTACKYGNYGMVLIDPKGVELSDYKELPNCIAYAVTGEETVRALNQTITIMHQRFKEMANAKQKEYTGNPIIVVIDEMVNLFLGDYGKTIERQIQDLTALARASKISVIACTQAPNRAILKATTVLNFTGRVALSCQTAIESRQIINVKGAEDLPMYGHCLYLRPGHKVEEWVVRMTSEEDKQQAIQDCAEINRGSFTNDGLLVKIFKRFIA